MSTVGSSYSYNTTSGTTNIVTCRGEGTGGG